MIRLVESETAVIEKSSGDENRQQKLRERFRCVGFVLAGRGGGIALTPNGFAGHAPASATVNSELTFHLDHSMGADHVSFFICKKVPASYGRQDTDTPPRGHAMTMMREPVPEICTGR